MQRGSRVFLHARWVSIDDRAIVAPTKEDACADDHCADRDFVRLGGAARQFEGRPQRVFDDQSLLPSNCVIWY